MYVDVKGGVGWPIKVSSLSLPFVSDIRGRFKVPYVAYAQSARFGKSAQVHIPRFRPVEKGC